MTIMSDLIAEMMAAGKDDEAIFRAVCESFAPYHLQPAFKEGFMDYGNARDIRQTNGYDQQAYDRGSNAAMWMWVVRNRRQYPDVKC